MSSELNHISQCCALRTAASEREFDLSRLMLLDAPCIVFVQTMANSDLIPSTVKDQRLMFRASESWTSGMDYASQTGQDGLEHQPSPDERVAVTLFLHQHQLRLHRWHIRHKLLEEVTNT